MSLYCGAHPDGTNCAIIEGASQQDCVGWQQSRQRHHHHMGCQKQHGSCMKEPVPLQRDRSLTGQHSLDHSCHASPCSQPCEPFIPVTSPSEYQKGQHYQHSAASVYGPQRKPWVAESQTQLLALLPRDCTAVASRAMSQDWYCCCRHRPLLKKRQPYVASAKRFPNRHLPAPGREYVTTCERAIGVTRAAERTVLNGALVR